MELDPESLGARDMYEWMTTTILPRPIAWISTVSPDGAANLAPFCFFQGVCARPPTLLFCPANYRHGRPKDTLRNVEATGEFVVNVVPWALVEAMNATSAALPYGESEFERFQVASSPAAKVRPRRVAASRPCRRRRWPGAMSRGWRCRTASSPPSATGSTASTRESRRRRRAWTTSGPSRWSRPATPPLRPGRWQFPQLSKKCPFSGV